MVDSLAQSNMGAVSNVEVQMDVDFDDGAVSNGALSVRVPDHTWLAVFDGQVDNGQLNLEYNGGAFTDASGQITGDFIGDAAEAVVGGFSMANNNNQIEGAFLVGQ